VVAFDFPAFDCCHVECEAPDTTSQKKDQAEQHERVDHDEHEKMRELQCTRSKILVCCEYMARDGFQNWDAHSHLEGCGSARA
jgi:hypothetical protein